MEPSRQYLTILQLIVLLLSLSSFLVMVFGIVILKEVATVQSQVQVTPELLRSELDLIRLEFQTDRWRRSDMSKWVHHALKENDGKDVVIPLIED